MFWDKGYAPSQNIEALLERENSTVEEFLDDEDILLECKSQKKAIVNYFTRPEVIKRLVQFIITEPSEDLPMAQRFRHANMACEILTLGLPSLDEKLLSDADTLKTLYLYLENEPPLNPLLSSFFSKTFSMLFTKKAEQDWFLYQQMCLKLLEYIKSQNNFLDLICKHFSTPVIPDLIMQMMRDVEGGQLKRNLYEWLTGDKLVERLIALLGNPQESDKHANVAEFFCDLIQQGRSMRQTEQENDSFEPAFDGSNPILKTIESEATIEALLNVILEPNAQESAIVSGITVVLTLIKPVVFVDEPNSDRLKFMQNREKDIHEQILRTVIRVIAPRLKDFNELLRNPPKKPDIITTAAKLSPPFGITRLQICRVFTVLLQTKNESVSKAICETDFFDTLLTLFKQYCWNNFLHSEVEKCLQLIFYTELSNNNTTQGSTIVNDNSFRCHSNNNAASLFEFVRKNYNNADGAGNSVDNGGGGGEGSNMHEEKGENENENATSTIQGKEISETTLDTTADVIEPAVTKNIAECSLKKNIADELKEAALANTDSYEDKKSKSNDNVIQDSSENDKTTVHPDSGPSALQTYVIVNCKLISKLIDCWQHNRNVEAVAQGRRLGYMGHLIKIFKHITNCISESEHIGALIENNLSDASELELWQSIINPSDGDFTKALVTQKKMLANCNAHEAGDYSQHLPKDFLSDNSTWDYIMSSNINMINDLGAFSDSSGNDIVFALEHEMFRSDLLDNDDNGENDLNLFQFGRNIDEDDDDEDENTAGGGDGQSLYNKTLTSTSALQAFGVTSNPWDSMDPFTDLAANSNASSTPWAADFGADNFADFDAHFSSFTNDLGESLGKVSKELSVGEPQENSTAEGEYPILAVDHKEEYDNNANVEKIKTIRSSEAITALNDLGEKRINIAAHNTDFVDDNAKNEECVASALVRTLHSVMQDSEDDYEDDEGMWTKPLGSNTAGQDEYEVDEKVADESEKFSNVYANGPSSKHQDPKVDENKKQLFSSNVSHDATTINITARKAELEEHQAKDGAGDEDSKPQQIDVKKISADTLDAAISDTDSKPACNVPVNASLVSTVAEEVEAPTT